MPLNIGTVTTSRMSFGPAEVFVGAAGATPTASLGTTAVDDGVALEFQAEMGEIVAGNPRTPVQRFAKMHGFVLRCTSLEFNANNLKFALGTGETSISGTHEIYRFGGDPCPEEVAVLAVHQKCTAAHTLNCRVWRAQSETGALSTQWGEEAHRYPYGWMALRSTTNWAGGSLASGSQLVEIDNELA